MAEIRMPDEEGAYDEDRFQSSLSWMARPRLLGLIKHWVSTT
jgi:hypothetical protein